MQPGWYEDPFARGSVRWWDGYAWTSHQAPAGAPPGQAQLYGMWQATPQGDLATEEKWANRALVAFVVIAVLSVVGLVVGAPLIGHYIRHWVDSCDTLADGTVSCAGGPSSGTQLLLDAVELPLLIPYLLMMVWLFQAARTARRIGLPARREPGWAFGFFVPIVNLWFPYQVARDTLPPGHPDRRTVGWWWALSVIQGVVIAPAIIVGMFSVPAALIVGAVGVIPAILAARYGLRMVSAVLDEHRRLLTTG